MFDLTGKNAIITGSSKGIGKSIAMAMAKQGANVVISSRKVDVCEATAEEINNLKDEGAGKAIVIPCNISDKTALEMLVEETRSQLGQIDILVCNAATNPYFGSIKDITDDAFEKIIEEIKEFKNEINNNNIEKAEQELGDIFFALIGYAQMNGMNSINALESTNQKFINRFSKVEKMILKENKHISNYSKDELSKFWSKVKSDEL